MLHNKFQKIYLEIIYENVQAKSFYGLQQQLVLKVKANDDSVKEFIQNNKDKRLFAKLAKYLGKDDIDKITKTLGYIWKRDNQTAIEFLKDYCQKKSINFAKIEKRALKKNKNEKKAEEKTEEKSENNNQLTSVCQCLLPSNPVASSNRLILKKYKKDSDIGKICSSLENVAAHNDKERTMKALSILAKSDKGKKVIQQILSSNNEEDDNDSDNSSSDFI